MNMFKPTTAKNSKEYFSLIKDPERKADLVALDKLIRKNAPKLKPYILAGVLAYGTYHYTSKSGREGDWYIIGLSSRAAYISLYICAPIDGKMLPQNYKKQLSNANFGKGCIRFKRLADVDQKVLAAIIKAAAPANGSTIVYG